MAKVPLAGIVSLALVAGASAHARGVEGPGRYTDVRWTTGGFRPSRTHQAVVGPKDEDLKQAMADRIPIHMDPIDLRSRDAFGAGIIEITESIKEAFAKDAARAVADTFSGGPYEVTEVLVRSRSPNWVPHDYGIGIQLDLHLRGIYRSREGWHQPVDFHVDTDVLVAEDGLVRVDLGPRWDWSPEAVAAAPLEFRHHLGDASARVAAAYGPRQLQDLEAKLRDLARAVLPLRRPAPGRKQPNPFRQEIYVPLSLREAKAPLDVDGNGRPDAEGIRLVNKVERIERGPLTRGGPPRYDFQQYVGWEIWVGDRLVLARDVGRLKFVLVADTDGDGLPDWTILEDRGERLVRTDPFHPVETAMLLPAIYFLDGQDMARDVYELGPVRWGFKPGEEGSEIRRISLVARTPGGVFRDWDVEMETFDPLGRVIEKGMVFERFPVNRKPPTQVGFQREGFAGPRDAKVSRGVKFRVHFGMNKHDLDKDAVAALEAAMKKVGGDHVARVRLTGHTCEQQTYEYNLALGWKRVRQVASFLAGKGIRPERMTLDSRGEYDPLESNTSDEGRAMNRRVDGWLVVEPAPPSRPPWYGRAGLPRDP